jgi:hypothetical protein
MDREEFERIKNEEKAHLREIRRLKGELSRAQRLRSINDALRGMGTGDLDETHDEFVRKLDIESLTAEARYEMAREAAGEEQPPRPVADIEEDLRKAEAAALVNRMKEDLAQGQAPNDAEPEPPAAEPPAEKTIGRMRRPSE